MTKHEKLIRFLRAAEQTARLEPTPITTEDGEGEWNGIAHPSIRWGTVVFTPALVQTVSTSLHAGDRMLTDQGWVVGREVYIPGTRDDPPNSDMEELGEYPNEWAAVIKTVARIMEEWINDTLINEGLNIDLEEAQQHEEAYSRQ